jgi:hypothetical protein
MALFTDDGGSPSNSESAGSGYDLSYTGVGRPGAAFDAELEAQNLCYPNDIMADAFLQEPLAGGHGLPADLGGTQQSSFLFSDASVMDTPMHDTTFESQMLHNVQLNDLPNFNSALMPNGSCSTTPPGLQASRLVILGSLIPGVVAIAAFLPLPALVVLPLVQIKFGNAVQPNFHSMFPLRTTGP